MTNNTLIMEQSDLTAKIQFRGNYVNFNKYNLITFQQIVDSFIDSFIDSFNY